MYADLEEVFVNKLNITAPTIENYVEQIRLLAMEEETNFNELKMAMVSLHYMRPEKKDLEPLEHVKFLPIKQLDGTVDLGSKDEEFFILDREGYRRLFHHKLPMLHLSLEEARQIHPLLSTLELDDRYLSFAIKENTAVHHQSPNPSANLTQEFQQKARAVYR